MTAAAPTRPRRTVALLSAGVGCLIGVTLAFSGGALIVSDRTQRDSSGYVMSSGEHYASPAYAFTTKSLEVPYVGFGGLARSVIGNVRITSDSARPVFLGIARAADASAYLGNVQRAVLSGNYEPRKAADRGGSAPATPPAARDFWAASASGAGQRTLTWKPRDGHWVAVLMNADGSRGVAAHVRIGGDFPSVGWIGVGLLVAGLSLAAAGGLFLKHNLT
jgi:hypothetical protein